MLLWIKRHINTLYWVLLAKYIAYGTLKMYKIHHIIHYLFILAAVKGWDKN